MTAEAAEKRTPLPMPKGLGEGGAWLWDAITTEHDLDAAQEVQLVEICRAKDRLDKLDKILRCEVRVWARLTYVVGDGDYRIEIDKALSEANATANLMKQMLAALRLPDAPAGKRPQHRGAARGADRPHVPGGAKSTGSVTPMNALERARQARGA